MREPPLDLFGQVRVTHDDVAAWLRAVPRIDPESPRAAAYVRGYDVPAKVAAAKQNGTFDAITAPPMPPPGHWWTRFHWTRA